jgi:hypothetical protein
MWCQVVLLSVQPLVCHPALAFLAGWAAMVGTCRFGAYVLGAELTRRWPVPLCVTMLFTGHHSRRYIDDTKLGTGPGSRCLASNSRHISTA